jgi:hypothetical protein
MIDEKAYQNEQEKKAIDKMRKGKSRSFTKRGKKVYG